MNFKIGVDGGGTKTECILVDGGGEIVARHLAAGCNPSVVGPDQAREIVTDALKGLTATLNSQPSPLNVTATLLCMSGTRGFWREFAASLKNFGRVTALDDSHPVLELATQGRPGLGLHAGTGSFVAARAPDGSLHYAGGLGWRFGDPGSGYDLGRRAIVRALLEVQDAGIHECRAGEGCRVTVGPDNRRACSASPASPNRSPPSRSCRSSSRAN